MTPDRSTLLSRQRGNLPDRFWNQLNGKTAAENYAEQIENRKEKDDDIFTIITEVRVK